LPLLEWTIVRLVVSENDGRRHNIEMEPQGRTIHALFCMRRQSKTPCLEKTTLRVRDYVQTVGLNAETKKDRHRAPGELFVLTFPLIGLYRLMRFRKSCRLVPHLSDKCVTPKKCAQAYALHCSLRLARESAFLNSASSVRVVVPEKTLQSVRLAHYTCADPHDSPPTCREQRPPLRARR
jgi:hypothetical protein